MITKTNVMTMLTGSKARATVPSEALNLVRSPESLTHSKPSTPGNDLLGPASERAALESTIGKLPPLASGSKESLIDYQDLRPRQQALVRRTPTAEDIAKSLGIEVVDAGSPARVVTGLMHNARPLAQGRLAFEELMRVDGLNGEKYDVVALAPPVAAGAVANSQIKALELVTHGRSVTVVLPYAETSAVMAMPRMGRARAAQREFLRLMNDELGRRTDAGLKSPTTLGLSESMGSLVLMGLYNDFRAEDLGKPGALHLDRLVLAGLPGGAGTRRSMLHSGPESDGGIVREIADPTKLSNVDALHYVLLANNDDPVAQLSLRTLFRRPYNYPEGKPFYPVLSLLRSLPAFVRAGNPPPGEYRQREHEYNSAWIPALNHVLALNRSQLEQAKMHGLLQGEELARKAALDRRAVEKAEAKKA